MMMMMMTTTTIRLRQPLYTVDATVAITNLVRKDPACGASRSLPCTPDRPSIVNSYKHSRPEVGCRVRLKCDGTRAETRFRLSPKQKSPFKSAGASVQSTSGSRGVRISGSNAGYMFRGSVESTGYPLHSPVSSSLPLPCVTVCHQVSNALYLFERSTAGLEEYTS